MSDDPIMEQNTSSFPSFIETIQYVKELMRPAIEGIQRLQEIMIPIAAAVADVQLRIQEVATTVAIVARPIIAIKKLGENQFVYWEHIPDDFVNEIIAANNVNELLEAWMLVDGVEATNSTISKCTSYQIMERHSCIFNQSVDAFRNGHTDLAVVGFTSIIDGLLTDASGSHMTNMVKRAEAVINKLNLDEILDNDEYATVTLMVTFQQTLESFTAFSKFSESTKEPAGLNRHWIMHGRSRSRKTKLDCVKLINFIYGILLINELGKNEE